jgi:hypothetical protein
MERSHFFSPIVASNSKTGYLGHQTIRPDNFGHKDDFKDGFPYICFFNKNKDMITSL